MYKRQEQFHEPQQRDAVGAFHARMQPVAPAQEGVKRRSAAPDERRAFHEVAAVAGQIPVAGEAAQALHHGKINELVLQNFVGWMSAVNHLPFGVVPDNWRAAQPFQDADLDFLRA